MLNSKNIYDKPTEINNYHEIKELSERRAYLQQLYDSAPEDAARCLSLFDSRYEQKDNQWIDKYMRAFMMLLTMNRASGLGFLNNKRKKEVSGYLTELGLDDCTMDSFQIQEWVDFAACYIGSCTSSKAYGSAFLGMITMPDKNIAMKIAADIDTALHEVPESYGLFEKSEPIFNIFKETYFQILEKGEDLWQEYLSSRTH